MATVFHARSYGRFIEIHSEYGRFIEIQSEQAQEKKPTLCCCFTWILFIELNFTVAFLLIRKTWDG